MPRGITGVLPTVCIETTRVTVKTMIKIPYGIDKETAKW